MLLHVVRLTSDIPTRCMLHSGGRGATEGATEVQCIAGGGTAFTRPLFSVGLTSSQCLLCLAHSLSLSCMALQEHPSLPLIPCYDVTGARLCLRPWLLQVLLFPWDLVTALQMGSSHSPAQIWCWESNRAGVLYAGFYRCQRGGMRRATGRTLPGPAMGALIVVSIQQTCM